MWKGPAVCSSSSSSQVGYWCYCTYLWVWLLLYSLDSLMFYTFITILFVFDTLIDADLHQLMLILCLSSTHQITLTALTTARINHMALGQSSSFCPSPALITSQSRSLCPLQADLLHSITNNRSWPSQASKHIFPSCRTTGPFLGRLWLVSVSKDLRAKNL